MATSLVDADSLLAIDVGSVTTRALLFDIVDGRYRFLATGCAATTAGAPFRDISEGVRGAIDQLQSITGRVLVGQDQRLIIPSRSNGSGIDTCVVTISAGAPLKVIAVGLLEDVSLESARRLASTIYSELVDTISLNDRRKASERLDTILRVRPDLVIVAGGTDEGASQSVLSLLEAVGLASYRMPKEGRPEVLFAGNQSLVSEVDSAVGSLVHLSVAPNIRPTLEIEQLSPAQPKLAQIYRSVSIRDLPGAQELDAWAGGRLMPSSTAFARMIRYLDKAIETTRGALGIDIGASSTTAVAACGDDVIQGVYPFLGLGEHIPGILEHTSIQDITRWLSVDVSDDDVLDYIYNKSLHPQSLPVTVEDLAIEQALARRAMQLAIRKLSSGFSTKMTRLGSGYLPLFEPVVAAGSVLTNAPSRGQSMLMLLDGLQPTGVTTVVLDQNNLLPALGAAAPINNLLPIQIIETSALLNLGPVISPVGNSQFGTPVMRIRVQYETGEETSLEVKFGSLELIPLSQGQQANLIIQPLNRFDVGMGGPGRGGNVKVRGGLLGVVIDARGRPIRLPADPARRREINRKWLWIFGG